MNQSQLDLATLLLLASAALQIAWVAYFGPMGKADVAIFYAALIVGMWVPRLVGESA